MAGSWLWWEGSLVLGLSLINLVMRRKNSTGLGLWIGRGTRVGRWDCYEREGEEVKVDGG